MKLSKVRALGVAFAATIIAGVALAQVSGIPQNLRVRSLAASTSVTVGGNPVLTTASGLNASSLSSGTIPAARFPATLPAVSGANLTHVDAVSLGGIAASDYARLSQNNTFAGSVAIENTTPIIRFTETDQPTDEKTWVWRNTGGVLALSTRDDAGNNAANAATVHRVGTTVTQFNLNATSVRANGEPIATVLEHTQATASVSGCSSTPTTSVHAVKVGRHVTVQIDSFTCTSNSSSLSVAAGLPAAFRPAGTVHAPTGFVRDNNSPSPAVCVVAGASPNISLGLAGNFTSSGTKGPAATISCSWISGS